MRSTRPSINFIRATYPRIGCVVMGRRTFDVVPVVFGSGRPFFGALGPGDGIALDNPTRVVQGDRVTHLRYDVS